MSRAGTEPAGTRSGADDSRVKTRPGDNKRRWQKKMATTRDGGKERWWEKAGDNKSACFESSNRNNK